MAMNKLYWGWATDDVMRQGGESGGFVSALMRSLVDDYDDVIVIRKVGTIFEGSVMTLSSTEESRKVQGALHSVCVELSHHIHKGRRTAIVLKPCDARAVIENIKRNHVDRDEVLLIGLNCGGTLPPVPAMQMLESQYDLSPGDVVKEEIDKGNLIFTTTGGDEVSKSIDDLEASGYGRRESCRYCDVKIPTMCDLACGNWGTPSGKNMTFVEVCTDRGMDVLTTAIDAGAVDVKEPSEKLSTVRKKIEGAMKKLARSWDKKLLGRMREMDKEERLNYIKEALAPCISCYGCRKACPVCKCSDDCKCMQFAPDDVYPISLFHSIRLLHLMESCIGCGNCTDVCPVDIPLAHLHQLFARSYESETGYKPGMSEEDVPPLSRGDFPEGY
jgi:formate dehydrogenase subunit beta